MDVERDHRVTMVRKVKSNFPVCKSWLNSRFRGQFEIKSLIVNLASAYNFKLTALAGESEVSFHFHFYVLIGQKLTGEFMRKIYAAS